MTSTQLKTMDSRKEKIFAQTTFMNERKRKKKRQASLEILEDTLLTCTGPQPRNLINGVQDWSGVNSQQIQLLHVHVVSRHFPQPLSPKQLDPLCYPSILAEIVRHDRTRLSLKKDCSWWACCNSLYPPDHPLRIIFARGAIG